MKKITMAVCLIAVLLQNTLIFADEMSVDDIVHKAWQGRRLPDGAHERTTWTMDGKHFAQDIEFSIEGKDGIWVHFFEPRKVKNKGVTMVVNPKSFDESPRFFCRGRIGGVREITTSLKKDLSQIDPSINTSWAIVLMQSGSEIFSDYLEYSLSKNLEGTWEILAKGDDVPDRIMQIRKTDFVVTQISFLNKLGDVSWLVSNDQVQIKDGYWYPTKITISNVENSSKSVLVRDIEAERIKWPKGFTKRHLPCGR